MAKDKSWGGYNVTRYEVVNGNIDLKQAIESSDNIFFARVALELGSKKFEKAWKTRCWWRYTKWLSIL